jgi:hypothetical protein
MFSRGQSYVVILCKSGHGTEMAFAEFMRIQTHKARTQSLRVWSKDGWGGFDGEGKQCLDMWLLARAGP